MVEEAGPKFRGQMQITFIFSVLRGLGSSTLWQKDRCDFSISLFKLVLPSPSQPQSVSPKPMGSPNRDFPNPPEPVWYPATAPPPSFGSPAIHHPSPSLTAATVNHVSRDEAPASVTKMEKGGGGGVVSWIVRRERRAAMVRSAAVGVRAAAAVLCLIAFSVMAADKSKGWALDSYNRYPEYRYVVAVNVIGFVYSGFQLFAEVHHMMNGKHFVSRPTGYYFDFAMDQILAYLLISASSSATARTDDWVTNYGSDPFPSMANGSVAMSFLAFFALAASAVFSAYNLFTNTI